MTPAIHIGPEPPEHLVNAVEDGGGRPVPLEEAEGVVWAGGPDELPELPSSVRWVQLPAAGVETWMERVAATPDVQFTSAGGAYATQVAEHALGAAARGRARDGVLRAHQDVGSRSPSACSRARRSRSSAPAGSAGS